MNNVNSLFSGQAHTAKAPSMPPEVAEATAKIANKSVLRQGLTTFNA